MAEEKKVAKKRKTPVKKAAAKATAPKKVAVKSVEPKKAPIKKAVAKKPSLLIVERKGGKRWVCHKCSMLMTLKTDICKRCGAKKLSS